MPEAKVPSDFLEDRLNYARAIAWIINFVAINVSADGKFIVKLDYIAFIHRIAAQRLVVSPGLFSNRIRTIGNSPLQTPPPAQIQEYMGLFIQTINEMWENSSPIKIASYALWALNYIHPFPNGNGRTARLFSYLTLNMKSGTLLHGKQGSLLPEILGGNSKQEYIKVLRIADNGNEATKDRLMAWNDSSLSAMEDLMSSILRQQLINSYN